MIPSTAIPLVLATFATQAAASDRKPPYLTLDPSVLNDIVVTATVEKVAPDFIIAQAINSPPVSLSEVTDGLVSGSPVEAGRGDAAVEVQAELNHATRQVLIPR